MTPLRKLFPLLLTVILLNASVPSFSQKVTEPTINDSTWLKPYPPFRIAGNLYYVGTYNLASYLITTPQGNILINTGTAQSASLIRKSVEALGFKFSDIKILLATHAHYDHVGAMAAIKKATGAKMMIEAADVPYLADGGKSDYVFKRVTFTPVTVDRALHNLDTVNLGGTHIIVLHHPGHTKGASSFLFNVKDEQHTYRVLIANMPSILSETKFPGMPTYPNVQRDYAYTLDTMPKIHFDLWLASHTNQFDLEKKHAPGSAYNPESFRDQKGYDEAIAELKKDYEEKVKGE